MTTKQDILDDFTQAFKARDEVKKRTLLSVKSEMLNFEKQKEGNEVTPDKLVDILKSMAKKRRESIEAYQAAGRNELATTELEELAVIDSYLPEQMSEAQVREAVVRLVNAHGFGAADFGKAMAAVMGELKGTADGGLVSRVLKEVLG